MITENCVALHDSFNHQWIIFRDPLEIHVASDIQSVKHLFCLVENSVQIKGLYAAGFVAYEAAPAFDSALSVKQSGDFPLLWFGIYEKPEAINFPSFSGKANYALNWSPSTSEKEYRDSFQKIKDYIEKGETYQVNYSIRLHAPFLDDPWQFFLQIIEAQGYGYGAIIKAGRWLVCSASPELFFRLEGNRLISRPMKGTVSRGLLQKDDLMNAAWLQNSDKNRAENVMIVDMVRNDMGRIADMGSVFVDCLFDIEKYPTLWQMTSTVCCNTAAKIVDIFCALFPAASITGTPKVRTMEIIRELETSPRNIYTGAIGFLSSKRKAQFNVAIRTVLIDTYNNTAEYGVGGGIVWDSSHRGELDECLLKAKVLNRRDTNFALLESIRWTPSDGYFLLDEHLQRLIESAAYFSRLINLASVRQKLDELSNLLPPFAHKIRLLISRDGSCSVEAHLLEKRHQYKICLAKNPIDTNNLFLYHKTTNRIIYENALSEVQGYDDVLLWNEKEEITETTIANIAVEIDGSLLTPPVACGLLPGVYRSHLLKQGKIKEQIIRIQDLKKIRRLFLINSVRGVWEPTEIRI